MTVKLDEKEVLFGLLLEKRVSEAQVVLTERQFALNSFIQYLGNKYELSGEVALNDWLIGFEVDDGKLHNQ